MPRIAFLLAFLLVLGVIVSPVSSWTVPVYQAPNVYDDTRWWINQSEVSGSELEDFCHANGKHACYSGGIYIPMDIWWCKNCTASSSLGKDLSGTGEDFTASENGGGFVNYSFSCVNTEPCSGYVGANTLTYIFGSRWQTTASGVIAPVAAFACDNVFANPSTNISCIDLSTNTPTSWELHSYLNYSGGSYDDHHADYTESPWTLNFPDMGYWDVNLKACNSAGCDWENKTDYIRIGTFQNWTPSPTITQIPTLPWTNITTMNVTPLRLNITGSLIGNLTVPLLDQIDTWRTQILTLFTAILGIFTYPIVLLNGFLTGTGGIFTATFSQLLSYTTVPMLITASLIGWMPWQIQGLITLGILFDLIILLLRGI